MIDVKLIYVEEFKNKKRPNYDNHPKPGHVYRAVKRKDTHQGKPIYQIFFDVPGDDLSLGMFIPGLEANNQIFKYKMRVVDIEDVLDLDLPDETYRKMEKWGPNFADGISEAQLNIPVLQNTVEEAEPKELKELAQKLANAIDNASRTISEGKPMSRIQDESPEMYKGLQFFAEYVADTFNDKYEASLLGTPAQKLIYNKAYGKGVNVFNAVKYLQRYMSEGHEKSGNPTDVLKAMHYLTFEITRLIIHGEIEA